MPLLTPTFQPPYLLSNPHLQTVLSRFVRVNPTPLPSRERIELSDGDFLDVDLTRNKNRRVAILSHGLEGSSRSCYISALSHYLAVDGWDIAAWNMRGCSGTSNRLLPSYHSGKSEDLHSVISWIISRYNYEQIILIGVSIGGNIVLKLLGETKELPPITAAVAISPPVDLASSARKLAALCMRPYMEYFLTRLRSKMVEKKNRFADAPDIAGLAKIRTFAQFDEQFTAPLNGFTSATDYWSKASSLPLLNAITVPTLLLTARDDPFLGTECYPDHLASISDALFLDAPNHGGHVGFLSRIGHPWYAERAARFVGQIAGEPRSS